MLRRAVGGLQVEQEPLALQAAGVAGELAAFADDPVTGDDHRKRVAAHSPADLASQSRVAQLPRQLAVSSGTPIRDAVDQDPRAPLELIAAGPRRQLEGRSLAGEVLGQLPLNLLEAQLGPSAESIWVGLYQWPGK